MSFKTFWCNFVIVSKNPDIWWLANWISIKATNARSIVGLFWYPLSNLIFAICISLILGSKLSKGGENYLVYLALGFLIWNLISAVIVNASRIFLQKRQTILSIRKPMLAYPVVNLARHTMMFALGFTCIPVVLVYSGTGLHWSALQVFVGAPLLLLNLLIISSIIGVLASRFGDVQEMIRVSMRPMFLLTPILWHPDLVTSRKAAIVDINPFYHLIELIRAPLLAQMISMTTWIYSITLGLLVLVPLYYRKHNQIAKWI